MMANGHGPSLVFFFFLSLQIQVQAPEAPGRTERLDLRYGDGMQYVGDWLAGSPGQRSGFGVHSWPEGMRYEGQWLHDERSGHGVHAWLEGWRRDLAFNITLEEFVADTGIHGWYQGEFRNDKMHGFGTYRFPDGKLYEGEWANDVIEGCGVLHDTDGKKTHGTWQHNELLEECNECCIVAQNNALEAAKMGRVAARTASSIADGRGEL